MSILRQAIVSTITAAMLAGCARGGGSASGGASAGSGASASAAASAGAPEAPNDACTGAANVAARVACLADAFQATLDTAQRRAVVVPATLAYAKRWSNLPCALSCRNGLLLGTLSEPQRAAALAVAQAALGASGYGTFEAIRKADDYLATHQASNRGAHGGRTGPPGPPPGGPPNGPPGGAPRGPPNGRGGTPPAELRDMFGPNGLNYAAGNYVIAFLGAPSATGRWTLQLGGHHHAVTVAFDRGRLVSATPTFLGVEPQTFTVGGVTYAPLSGRRDAMYGMIQSLDDAQRTTARLGARFDDVLLGPGKDWRFLTQQEGVAVSSLGAAQQALVRAAIEAWVRDTPNEQAAGLLAEYTSPAALAATRVAWSGATTPTVSGSYVRIDGPRVWIEFVCQNGVEFRDQIHFHSIWRDKTRDYGGDIRS